MPTPFDILDQLGKFAQLKNVSLNATDLRGAFSEYVAVEVDKALGDPILLHGQRTEAMFEALLLSLSKFKLLKREDIGQVYPHNHFIAPDFRVVLENGAQWLIEVKNVYESDASKQSRTLFGQDYYRQLNGYADAVGGELKLAVFWARWSVWTLVSPAKLVDAAGNLTLDMMTAIKINEMGTLGDMMIGTTAPLTLRLTTDPDRTSPIGPDGEVKIVFGKSQIFSENRESIQLNSRLHGSLCSMGSGKNRNQNQLLMAIGC